MNADAKKFLKSIPGVGPSIATVRLWPLKIKSVRQWKELSQRNEIRLELGSGIKKGINGFTTVDLLGADIHRDLRDGIPLADNTVTEIYTSHMLEHIPYAQLLVFLRECRRVLKDGGRLSVCVPNSRYYIQAYINRTYFLSPDRYYQPSIVDTGSYLDQVNYIAYMSGEHCYMFDEENLVNTLRKSGFSSVSLRQFDETIDLKERDFESIYAIATK